MKKTKKDLSNYLSKRIEDITFNKTRCEEIMNGMLEKHHIPMGMTMDMMGGRVILSDQSDFMLFCLLSFIDGKEIPLWFTDIEIKQYSVSLYSPPDAMEFPIKIKCIQVANDQWIGATDVHFLMKLRKAQMINYNVNAQRTMQKVIKGRKEIYKIALNKAAVNEIRQSFKNNIYIPNTITLNIPIEDADFYYDKENNILIINKIKYFDISDGYHRFISMCQEKDSNPNFNYPMELRVISFTDDKAKQFIYQEDKKTKMRKIDSQSMDMNNSANIVAERLNQDTMCNLKGMINRNNSIIPFAEFSSLIDYFYFKDCKKEDENRLRIQTVKELREKLNCLTEYDEKYLKGKYTFKELAIIMYIFSITTDLNNIGEMVDATLSKISTIDEKKFYNRTPRKSLFNEVEKVIKEC